MPPPLCRLSESTCMVLVRSRSPCRESVVAKSTLLLLVQNKFTSPCPHRQVGVMQTSPRSPVFFFLWFCCWAQFFGFYYFELERSQRGAVSISRACTGFLARS